MPPSLVPLVGGLRSHLACGSTTTTGGALTLHGGVGGTGVGNEGMLLEEADGNDEEEPVQLSSKFSGSARNCSMVKRKER